MAFFNSPQFWLSVAQFLTALLTIFIAWVTYQSYKLLSQLQPDTNLLLSLPETMARIGLVAICLVIAWLSGLSKADLGFTVNNLWRSVGLGVGAGLIVQIAVFGTTIVAINRFGRHIYSPWLIRNILPKSAREWLLVTLAFIPPVAMEELLFRSLWLGLFGDSIALAALVVGTSIVFGLMHLPQGALGVIVAGTINIVFSLLFIWSGELLVTLIAHYTVNMVQLLVAHVQRDWLNNY